MWEIRREFQGLFYPVSWWNTYDSACKGLDNDMERRGYEFFNSVVYEDEESATNNSDALVEKRVYKQKGKSKYEQFDIVFVRDEDE